jgi:hypothetical protein
MLLRVILSRYELSSKGRGTTLVNLCAQKGTFLLNTCICSRFRSLSGGECAFRMRIPFGPALTIYAGDEEPAHEREFGEDAEDSWGK